MERIIAAIQQEGTLCAALLEDGKLVEYWEDGAADLAGQIVKGKVERVVPGMQAAFVRIGLEKNGFLPLDERPQQETCPLPPLRPGQEILVQVKKAPAGQKGAYLTRAISLAGEYALFLPGDRFLGVSARIQDEGERMLLREKGEALLPEDGGLVMRAAALAVSEEAIREDIHQLTQSWHTLAKEAAAHSAPYWASQKESVIAQIVRDYVGKVDMLVTNDEKIAAAWECRMPVIRRTAEQMEAGWCFSKQLGHALRRKVWLKSGGYLVIDPCEAMTVIDVNTGKFTGKHRQEETIFRLDLEACGEIARQARLRNLGGIILVDFIDMKDEGHREKILEALQEAFRQDRVKVTLHGFTALGLMEITRKKTSPTLWQRMGKVCPACHGEGRIHKQGGENDG